MKLRQIRKIDILAILLVLFTVVCRFSSSVADAYALYVYPHVSAVLSWLSSVVPFGIQEIIIAMVIGYVIVIIYKGVKFHRGMKRTLIPLLRVFVWLYIWFYMAWCVNYSRSAIYLRTSEKMEPYNEVKFKRFAENFINETNDSYVSIRSCNKELVINEIKSFYTSVPAKYGLTKPNTWQQPKHSICNVLYSSVGVLGFMAPLLSESYLNADLPDVDYPFTYAHELSHLLGVSNEAEANWWAFNACASSADPAIRYSAYKGILPHLLNNASFSLKEEEYNELFSKVRPEIMEDVRNSHEHWKALQSPVLRKLHSVSYDLFLKGNNINKGIENYSEVIALLVNVNSPLSNKPMNTKHE